MWFVHVGGDIQFIKRGWCGFSTNYRMGLGPEFAEKVLDN